MAPALPPAYRQLDREGTHPHTVVSIVVSCDAQAVEAFFRKQYKRKPKSLGAADAAAEEMFILENGDELTAEEQDVAQAAEADAAEESHGIPVAQLVKDKAAIKTMKEQAIEDMEQRGIYLSDQEQKMALGVLPKVRTFIFFR